MEPERFLNSRRDFRMDLPLTSSSIRDEEEEETCTICQEDLSMRLAGERPHVVPQCGHRLRE